MVTLKDIRLAKETIKIQKAILKLITLFTYYTANTQVYAE